jgi:hypothetical protein
VLLVVGAIGIGAWIYFGNDNGIAKDTNVKNSFPENSAKDKNKNSGAFPPVNTEKKPTVKPTAAATPAPEFDAEEVKQNVSKTVYAWKSASEAVNLPEHISYYADRVDYYNRKGAGLSTIRADKRRAFSAYDTIRINLSNMRVTPDNTGENATAVFDKEWYFESDEKVSEGKVQSQLRLKKIGGVWKITGERDLKVYYVN